MTSGCRSIWFDKEHPDCLYVDRRPLIVPTQKRGDKLDVSTLAWTPDIVADNSALPFRDNLFSLIVYDPPHRGFTADSNMGRRYGPTSWDELRGSVRAAAKESHRVAEPGALFAMKWNDVHLSMDTVLGLMFSYWRALVGHSMIGTNAQSITRWVLLKRVDDRLGSMSHRRVRRPSFLMKTDGDHRQECLALATEVSNASLFSRASD